MNLNHSRTVGLLCTLGLAGACGKDDGSVGQFTSAGDSSPTAGSGDDTGGGDGSTASGSGVDGTGTGSADDTDGGQKFDVGSSVDIPGSCSPDNADDPECHCNAVDVLFIVDNSGSMNSHRDAVRAAFDDMIEAMIEALPTGTDLHVGLTRATGFFDPGNSSGTTGCNYQHSSQWNPPEQSNNGVNGQQGRLYEHQGKRYFESKTNEDPTPLLQWFEGALAGTINGSVPHSNTETVVAGAAYPFHEINAAHNEGFVRDQAVLILFLLSDTVDMTPEHIPTQFFIDMVSNRKAACGDHCIITTGAIYGSCYVETGPNTRLYDFMNGFGRPPASYLDIWRSNPDYRSVVGTAFAEVVAATCNVIPPAG